jgi:hypothetical protein
MNIKRLAGIAILILIFIMGCSGNYANIKNQSQDESKVTQKKLINNWSNYNIRYNSVVVVFDPKNDDKKILVENYWSRVNDHETWAQIVNGNTSGKHDDDISLVWTFYSNSGVREIWSPNDQFYGYVLYRQRELVSAKLVDEYTIRLIHNYGVYPFAP